MKMSPFTGITTRIVEFTDDDINNFKTEASKDLQTLVTGNRIKQTTYSHKYYANLGSTIPAVSFVKFSFADKSISTISLPPKYVKKFVCERVSDSVGKFSIDLFMPMNTFEPQAEEINIHLLALFGLINNSSSKTITSGDCTTVANCSLEYGWRNSNTNAVYTFDSAGVYGMTLNYDGNYYKYTIQGLTNSIKDEASAVKQTNTIEISKFNYKTIEARQLAAKAAGYTDSEIAEQVPPNIIDAYAEDMFDTNLRITVPAGTTIYNGHYEKTTDKTEETQELSLSDKSVSWVNNNKHLKYNKEVSVTKGYVNGVEVDPDNVITWDDLNGWEQFLVWTGFTAPSDYGTIETTTYTVTEFYAREDLRIQGDSISNHIYTNGVVDFSKLPAGYRISDLVELLADYIFGNSYNIIVEHVDKEYTEDYDIPVKSSAVALQYNNSIKFSGTNSETTSWYTYLLNLIAQCQDCREQDLYNTYKAYDIDNDGLITQADLAAAQSQYNTYVDQKAKYDRALEISKKWSKLGYPLMRPLELWEYAVLNRVSYKGTDLFGYFYTEDGASYDEIREEERQRYRNFQNNTSTVRNGAKTPAEYVADIWPEFVPDINGYNVSSTPNIRQNTYIPFQPKLNSALLQYKLDLDFFWENMNEPEAPIVNDSGLSDLAAELAASGDLISNYAIKQYYLYYIEKSKGMPTIYIGPGKTPDFRYTYTVGNTQKDSNVISFSIQEDLVYLISAAKMYKATEAIPVISTSGTIELTAPDGKNGTKATSAHSEQYAIYLANAIMDKISAGQIEAKLTVLTDTNSLNLSVTDYITVKCTNNGADTMFTGQYMIKKITDTIDEQGKLTTEFTLQFTQLLALEQFTKQVQDHFNTILNQSNN